jgi:hypothetical protein
MLIHSCPAAAAVLHPRDARSAGVAPPTIAIVNGSPRALQLLETTPELDRYTLLFLDSRTGAYGDIKRLRPSFVVLSAQAEEEDAWRFAHDSQSGRRDPPYPGRYDRNR